MQGGAAPLVRGKMVEMPHGAAPYCGLFKISNTFCTKLQAELSHCQTVHALQGSTVDRLTCDLEAAELFIGGTHVTCTRKKECDSLVLLDFEAKRFSRTVLLAGEKKKGFFKTGSCIYPPYDARFCILEMCSLVGA